MSFSFLLTVQTALSKKQQTFFTLAKTILQSEGDPPLTHLPLYREVPKALLKNRRPQCRNGCGRLTATRFALYSHDGLVCRMCERKCPDFHAFDSTTAKQRFYLSKDDLNDVPAITKYVHGSAHCGFFRPADLLAGVLKQHGGQEGLERLDECNGYLWAWVLEGE
jgi:hypothetical protein